MISPETYQQILSDSMDFCTNVRKIDPKESLDFIMSDGYLQSQAEFYQSVLLKLGLDPEGKKILEIGSGYGFFMVYAIAKLGWNLHGVEPGENEFSGRYEIGQDILTQNNINKERLTKATGENTHLPPGSFDIIVTHDVLEHVSDPEGVLFECARLLTPGGVLIAGMPNYRWIYEGHYNMPWFPFFSKSFAKKYVSLAGRDKSYIDSLHFLNPKMVKSIVRRISGIEVCFPLEHGGYGGDDEEGAGLP